MPELDVFNRFWTCDGAIDDLLTCFQLFFLDWWGTYIRPAVAVAPQNAIILDVWGYVKSQSCDIVFGCQSSRLLNTCKQKESKQETKLEQTQTPSAIYSNVFPKKQKLRD